MGALTSSSIHGDYGGTSNSITVGKMPDGYGLNSSTVTN
jgi:hypothetical protein